MSNRERNILIYSALILSVIGGIAGVYGISGLKNVRFVTPAILLPFCFSTRVQVLHKEKVYPFYHKLFVLYLLVAVYTFFSAELYFETGFTYRNVVNIILIFTPLVVGTAISRVSDLTNHNKIINFLFFSFIGLFFVEITRKGFSMKNLLGVFQANIITDSDFETESGVSLILGFYALYYLHTKQKLLMFAAFFFTVLGAKRIAIFGLLLAVVLYYVYPFIIAKVVKRQRVGITVVLCIIGVALASAWHGIITGQFDKVVEDLTGLSVNRFFMGRIGRFEIFLSHLHEDTGYGLGYGLGYVENVLYYAANYVTAFHNDYYRLYLELGVLFFMAWLGITIYWTIGNRLAFAATFLLIILMQTDNVFMYDRVMYSYFIICAFALKFESQYR